MGLYVDMVGDFPELDAFVRTFETWQEEILNYFDARQTSGPVEGINNKARVIVKRAYGLKSADSLWTRLVLDLNRARDVVTHTIGQMRDWSPASGPFSHALLLKTEEPGLLPPARRQVGGDEPGEHGLPARGRRGLPPRRGLSVLPLLEREAGQQSNRLTAPVPMSLRFEMNGATNGL